MAEATTFRNNALPYPVYGVPWVVVFPLLDADGDPISPSSPDSERSLNGDTFADCTNEATEIATSTGVCYLALTAAEMTADIVAVRAQSTGAKTTVMALYPRKLVSLRAGTSQAGAAGTITLDSGASAVDDYYNGCLIVGVLDAATEARVITDYVGSTKVASVTPNWNTTPDSDDTFTIYLPEGRQILQGDNVAFNGVATTSSAGRPEVNTTHAAGTAWASGAITAGAIATDAITAAKIATGAIDADAIAADAITAVKIATGAITAAKFAAGAIDAAAIADGAIDAATLASDTITAAKIAADAITATKIATGAITAAKFAAGAIDAAALAADAGTEIGTAVWATATRVLTANTNLNDLSAAGVRTAVGLASANLDTQLDALPTNAELATALAAADDAVLAAIAALNNLSTAQVNAEVLDVLNVDTFAQPGQGTPLATTTIRQMLGYIYKWARNKSTQTATQLNMFNDDASTVDHIAAVSDSAGVFTRGELATGP